MGATTTCPVRWPGALSSSAPSQHLAHGRCSVTSPDRGYSRIPFLVLRRDLAPLLSPGQYYSKPDANIVLEVSTTR